VVHRVHDQGVPVGEAVGVARPVQVPGEGPGALPLALARRAAHALVLDDAIVLGVGDEDRRRAVIAFEILGVVLFVQRVVIAVPAQAEVDRLRRAVDDDHLVEVPWRDEELALPDPVDVVDVRPVFGHDALAGVVGIVVLEGPLPGDFLASEIVDEHPVLAAAVLVVVDARDEEFVTVDQVDVVDVRAVEAFGPDAFPGVRIEFVDHRRALHGVDDEQVAVRQRIDVVKPVPVPVGAVVDPLRGPVRPDADDARGATGQRIPPGVPPLRGDDRRPVRRRFDCPCPQPRRLVRKRQRAARKQEQDDEYLDQVAR